MIGTNGSSSLNAGRKSRPSSPSDNTWSRIRMSGRCLGIWAKASEPDLLILDHVLSEGELGLDFLPEFKEVLPFVPIVVVSGALEVHQQLEALQGPRRAHYCLTKPVDVHSLKKTVETALKECGEQE